MRNSVASLLLLTSGLSLAQTAPPQKVTIELPAKATTIQPNESNRYVLDLVVKNVKAEHMPCTFEWRPFSGASPRRVNLSIPCIASTSSSQRVRVDLGAQGAAEEHGELFMVSPLDSKPISDNTALALAPLPVAFDAFGPVPTVLSPRGNGGYSLPITYWIRSPTNLMLVFTADWYGGKGGRQTFQHKVSLPSPEFRTIPIEFPNLLNEPEKGRLIVRACPQNPQSVQPMPSGCVEKPYNLELLSGPSLASSPKPLLLPAGLAVAAVLFAALSVRLVKQSDLNVLHRNLPLNFTWKLDVSFASNINAGGVFLAAVLPKILGPDGLGQGILNDEFAFWGTVYGSSLGLAPAFYALTKVKSDPPNDPKPTVFGFYLGTLTSLFGAFGSLLLTFEQLRRIGESGLLDDFTKNFFLILPSFFGLLIFRHMSKTFQDQSVIDGTPTPSSAP
jgi:hypothetical protein